MEQSVYTNGVGFFNQASLPGKVGRVAMEIVMAEKLQHLGYSIYHNFELQKHITTMKDLLDRLYKQLGAVAKRHK